MEGEVDRGERMPAPVLFRVLLRMRLLHRHAVRMLSQVARTLVGGQRGGEGRFATCALGAHALAGNSVDRVSDKIMQAGAGPLVGVRDSAATLQPPFARGSDGAINAARTRR